MICFIDEVRECIHPFQLPPDLRPWTDYTRSHLSADTLFNLGKAEGSIDAGQMIKPALARGLQLVGATTRQYAIHEDVFSLN